jgi:hypothetical protein
MRRLQPTRWPRHRSIHYLLYFRGGEDSAVPFQSIGSEAQATFGKACRQSLLRCYRPNVYRIRDVSRSDTLLPVFLARRGNAPPFRSTAGKAALRVSAAACIIGPLGRACGLRSTAGLGFESANGSMATVATRRENGARARESVNGWKCGSTEFSIAGDAVSGAYSGSRSTGGSGRQQTQ